MHETAGYRTEAYDESWERAWTEASEFERRRYRSLDWKAALAAMMLVASGESLGEAVKVALPYAADWTPRDS